MREVWEPSRSIKGHGRDPCAFAFNAPARKKPQARLRVFWRIHRCVRGSRRLEWNCPRNSTTNGPLAHWFCTPTGVSGLPSPGWPLVATASAKPIVLLIPARTARHSRMEDGAYGNQKDDFAQARSEERVPARPVPGAPTGASPIGIGDDRVRSPESRAIPKASSSRWVCNCLRRCCGCCSFKFPDPKPSRPSAHSTQKRPQNRSKNVPKPEKCNPSNVQKSV
jgi:hypothetical protein